MYSLNHYPERTGIGKYNGDMAQTLVQKGVDVSVLCAPRITLNGKQVKGIPVPGIVQSK
ncbi:hypothetical protein [Salinimonas marina]|uniref:hypothetical protein n=1 Tax=Salinimonas marina TaxID=2785918 RepID=UPI001E2A2566|nr:hypothetical protein [Salinimonas marina]